MAETFGTWVLTYDGSYLRFGSYNKADCTPNLMSATLYSRLNDAKRRRLKQTWINGFTISGARVKIKRVTVELKSEEDVDDVIPVT